MRRAAFLLAGLAAVAAPGGALHAQDGGCQLVAATSGPPRQILKCPSGPLIEAENAADVHVIDKGGQGKPTGAQVNAGAALIDVPPGYPGGFQILAPRATASVRGTRWAVDVQAKQTSVLVVRGAVQVQRVKDGRTVVLKAGEGVDVRDGSEPLKVTRWPARRASALLARFGR